MCGRFKEVVMTFGGVLPHITIQALGILELRYAKHKHTPTHTHKYKL
jgi:hypothetical protein